MLQFKQLIGEIHRRSLWQVLLIYIAASWAVLEVSDVLVSRLALPDWIIGAAIVLLLVGLPVVLATAFVQEGLSSASHRDPTLIPGAGPDLVPRQEEGARKLLTWRNAIMGGALAFGLWGVAATGWVLFGDQAAGSNDGGLDPARVVVLPFDDRTGDPALEGLGGLAADWVTRELERALGEVVQVVPATSVRQLLGAATADSALSLSEVARHFVAGTAIFGKRG